MASKAHCFYCFECLSASFERREQPSLDRVTEYYDQYVKATVPRSSVADHDQDGIGQVDVDELSSEDEEGIKDGRIQFEEEGATSSNAASRPQIPSLSRLQAATPSSHSSSSSSPSILSANSSNSQLTAASSTSTVSSRPSYASQLTVNVSYPLFVTWNTISRSGHASLRGCIGTFDPMPLSSGLSTYALTSAFDDTRFSPIPASLLSALSCSLTLLADFETCNDVMDWTLGKHGLRISFTYRGRRHGATYLPDVAVEQGWTKDETLDSLMRKAGWDGGHGHGVAKRLLRGSSRSQDDHSAKPWDEVGDFRAIRYTGLRSNATYIEWKEWHTWLDEQGKVLG